MRPFPMPMMMGGRGRPVVTYIAGGSSVSHTTSPGGLGSGAQVGDLMIICSPYGNLTMGTSGWTSLTYSWYGANNYAGNVQWKVLTSADFPNLSWTGDSYSVSFMILRGPTSVAKVIGTEGGRTVTDQTITWPTPDPNCLTQVIMSHIQSSSDTSCDSDFTDRFYSYPSGVISLHGFTRVGAPIAGNTTLHTISNGVPHYVNGLELRF